MGNSTLAGDHEGGVTEEPGLHRVGPNPWDYVYNPAKGQRVASPVDGRIFTGVITGVVEDEVTGELGLTVDERARFLLSGTVTPAEFAAVAPTLVRELLAEVERLRHLHGEVRDGI